MTSDSYSLREGLENDLLEYWEDYESDGRNLVKEGEPISSWIYVRVSGAGEGRSRIAIKKAFAEKGYDVEDAVAIEIRGGGTAPIKTADYRVELTPYGIEAGEVIRVRLISGEDTIPIRTVTMEAYVRGEYRNSRGVITRKITIRGTKTLIMGRDAPKGVDEDKFWDTLYSDLDDTMVDEFIKSITEDGYEGDENAVPFTEADLTASDGLEWEAHYKT